MAVFFRLLRDCLRYPGRLIVATMTIAGLGVIQLYLTWLVKRWVEGPLLSGDAAALREILMQGALLTVAGMIALFLSRYLIASVGQRLVEDLRNRAVERWLSLDVVGARRRLTGDVMARLLHDAGGLSSFLGTIVERCVREAIVAIGALLMLFVLKWQLALAVCALVPVTAVLLVRIGRVIRRWGTVAQAEVGRVGATLNEQLHGLTTIKGFQTERYELERLARQNAEYRASVLRAEWWSSTLIAVVFLTTGIGLIVLVWYGTAQLGAGAMTPGALLSFCLYAGQMVEPLRRLSEVHGFLEATLPRATRVYELIDALPAEPQNGVALLVRGPQRVDFEDVSFCYRDDRPILRRVTLTIRPLERVALVGATGAGKSTFASLLVRFCEPQQGRIALDGVDVRALRLADLRKAIAIVEQDPFLFSGPLIDNIRYGSWQASPAAIQTAVELAGLEPLVAAIPGGLHGTLAEAGQQLSGGEKQRIALARAIVRDPGVVVLDESTSAIDSETEGAIVARLERWLSQRTVLAIGHRLSTIARFPRIIVLDDGRVAGDGSAETLIRTCPPFVELFADQIGSVAPMNV